MAAPIIWLGGGGTGGHIFPNVAAMQRLREQGGPLADARAVYLVSTRPHDRDFLGPELDHGATLHPVAARPLSGKPWTWPAFATALRRATHQLLTLAQSGDGRPVAAVVTGGFVSAPVVSACHRLGVPVLLMNLDAVPGKANRLMAGRATEVFAAYPCNLNRAQVVGMPLRSEARAATDPAAARSSFGLDPEQRTLLVTGASQGASSMNQMMLQLLSDAAAAKRLQTTQVIHLTGFKDEQALAEAYRSAGVTAAVRAFVPAMGQAWAAATMAVSRAGAGSVAEAWVNRVPTVFLPYPYHRDEHQKFNAQPLVDAGGGVLERDRIDPEPNAAAVGQTVLNLLGDAPRLAAMRQAMANHPMGDGAAAVAQWLGEQFN